MTHKSVFLTTTISILIFHFSEACYPRPQNGRVVSTESGQVKGSIGHSRDGRLFFQFFKIPFAQPPVGKLRFASPKPLGKWKGVLDGRYPGPQCAHLQSSTFFQAGEEDCLHLNIFTPKLRAKNNDDLLPVMVWIHGGAFIGGSAVEYSPSYFMDTEVVLVTINYRTGILGFLTTADEEIRGNMGLKDQVLALQWVQKNIQNFAGNPSKITIMGESAGGASVSFLMLSDKTKGLFQKAISMSGSALAPWAFQSSKTASERTKRFAGQLNCSNNSSVDMVQCLRGLKSSTLLSVYRWDTENLYITDPTLEGDMLRPVLETVDDDKAFLTRSPYDILADGQAHRIPWLTGIVADEGLFSSLAFVRNESLISKMEQDWDKNVLHFLNVEPMPHNITSDIRSKLQTFYFGQGQELSVAEKQAKFTQLYTDGLFYNSMNQVVNFQRQLSPVYLYFFNKTDGLSFAPALTGIGSSYRFQSVIQIGIKYAFKIMMRLKPKGYGVCHADDILVLFPFNDIFKIAKNEEDDKYKFSKQFVKLWTQFATDENVMEFDGIPFTPNLAEGPLKYMNFDNTKTKMIDEPFKDRLEFWKSLDVIRKYSDAVKNSMNISTKI